MNLLAQHLQAGIAHHQAGRLAQAEAIYLSILRDDPRQADALHLLGVVEGRRGAFDSAIARIRAAIAQRPDAGGYQNSLGNLLRDAGRPDEALAAFDRAIAAEPLNPTAHANRGTLNLARRAFDRAAADCREALTLMRRAQPAGSADQVRVWGTLAVALAEGGRLTEAEAELRALLSAAPNVAAAHSNLSAILSKTARLSEAEVAGRRAVELDPRHAAGWNTLGIALHRQGRAADAAAAYHRAIELDPRDVGARLNLSRSLESDGALDEALACADAAAAIVPTHPGVQVAIGSLHRGAGRLDEAMAAFDLAVELDPGNPMTHSGRIFARHFHAGSDEAAIAADQRLWNDRHAAAHSAAALPHANGRDPDRPIRVGYLSPDFTQHVLAFLMLPLFEHHDRTHVEAYFYSDVAQEQAVTERFKRCAAKWTSTVGWSDERVAQAIRDDGVDVLVDLTMHMQDGRLSVFARRPAPVQITWCYPGSTGLTAIDWRVTDPQLDPPGRDESVYSERTYRLPDTFFCYSPLADVPAVAPLPAMAAGRVTFGCLNNFSKTNAGVLDAWARVLAAVPDSRMIVLSPPGRHRAAMEAAFAARGVSADRIEHVGRMSRPDYLAIHASIDIALDTFPYNGHTTSLDGFWMGVPVVTLVGHTVVGRAGLSELTNLGLTELAASSVDEYVGIAAGLAGDLPRLVELRAGLRGRMERSPLMDGARFARHFETMLRGVWQTWCTSR